MFAVPDVTPEDTLLACAVALNVLVGDIRGFTFDIRERNGQEQNILTVCVKDKERTILLPPNSSYNIWVYHFLEKKDLLGWRYGTRH